MFLLSQKETLAFAAECSRISAFCAFHLLLATSWIGRLKFVMKISKWTSFLTFLEVRLANGASANILRLLFEHFAANVTSFKGLKLHPAKLDSTISKWIRLLSISVVNFRKFQLFLQKSCSSRCSRQFQFCQTRSEKLLRNKLKQFETSSATLKSKSFRCWMKCWQQSTTD